MIYFHSPVRHQDELRQIQDVLIIICMQVVQESPKAFGSPQAGAAGRVVSLWVLSTTEQSRGPGYGRFKG